MSKDDKNQPMDPSAREGASPDHVTRQVRNAYALDILLHEVEQTFGEVPVVLGEPDEWQVIHEATFDTQGVENLADALNLVSADLRVAYVEDTEGVQVKVAFTPNRRTRDLLDGFGVPQMVAVWNETPVTDDGPPLEEDPEADADLPPVAVEEDDEPEAEPVYISKASGKRVTRAYGEANPDKVTVQE